MKKTAQRRTAHPLKVLGLLCGVGESQPSVGCGVVAAVEPVVSGTTVPVGTEREKDWKEVTY